MVVHVAKSLLILQLWCGFWLQFLHNIHSCLGEEHNCVSDVARRKHIADSSLHSIPHKSLIYLASINWRFFKQNLQDPPNHRIATYPAGINCRFLKRNLQVVPIAHESNLISQIIAVNVHLINCSLVKKRSHPRFARNRHFNFFKQKKLENWEKKHAVNY